MFCLPQDNSRTYLNTVNGMFEAVQGGLILNVSSFKHNFSKVYTRNERYLLVGCVDCEKTITFFHRRKN